MKYGVIGTGWITAAFISGADAAGSMEMAAVMSRNAEKGAAFAESVGRPEATVVTSVEELAALDIEGVYVASPNQLHYRQSKYLLEHGKHVICEKPITITPEQLTDLQALAASKGLVYMEALMMLHLPQREIVREALKEIGTIHSAHIDFSQRSSKLDAYLRGETPNIFNPALGTGGLMDLGIYCVYPILDWFGMPDSVMSSAKFLRTGADHSGAVLFNYPDMQITMTYSKVGQGHGGSEIIGDGGSIRIGSISLLTQIYKMTPKGEATLLVGDKDKTYSMAGEAAAFRDRVNGVSEQPESERRLTLQVSEIMEEIRRQSGIEFTGVDEVVKHA